MTIEVLVENTLGNWVVDTDVKVFGFPGGEPHVSFSRAFFARGHRFAIDVRGKDASNLMGVLVTSDALRRKGAKYVALLIPYLPGARQDRGAPLTAKVYADLINSAKFDQVVAIDPHSDVMPALLNNLQTVPLAKVWEPLFDKLNDLHPALLIPDQGAGKRVGEVAAAFGWPTVQAFKHRDSETGQLSGFTIDSIPKDITNIVVLDDICDGGGTFLGLYNAIREVNKSRAFRQMVFPYLAVTHGIFSRGLIELGQHFLTITTTDSFPTFNEHRKLTVLPIRELMLDPLEQ